MKHYLLSVANGLHTPPCNNSHGKSSHFFNFRFSLFTPLLVLFLLIVGNSPAWGDGYYAVHGNNWQGTDGGQWNDNNNKARMSHQSDGVYWCDKVAVNNGTTILFKILYGSGYDGSGFDWENQITAANIDNSRGNAALVNDNSDNRIQYTATENVDLYIYTNGTKVWANAVKQGCSSLLGKTIRLQGDLWTAATSGDWAIKDCSPTLQVSPAGEMATTAFYIPAGMNDKYTKARWETYVNGTKTNYNEAIFNGCSNDGSANAKIIAKIQNSTSCVKYVKVEYTSARTTITVTDPPAMTGNWYLWIDKVYKGQFVDGKIDIENLPVGSGLHSIFVTNRTESQIGAHKDKTVKDYFTQGIEWLGGLYIDTEHSDVPTWKKGRYYKDESNYTKFSNREDFPLINGGTDYNDARGGFQYSTVSNVRFTLNNGVITINAVDHIDAGPKYTVTIHPNNGGSDIIRENVPEGSNSSATELNLSAVTYGKGTATWYTDAECTTPFTTVTGDMDLYAKWGVSGNYYFVSSLQTASDAGETGNWNSGWAKQLNYTSGNPGKCSYSFIAPAGRLPFELLTSTSGWNSIGADNNLINNDASNVTVAVSEKHFYFELPEPKKVTISYDGKVSINVEDYNFDDTKTWHIKTSWASSGGGDWNYNTVLTNSTNGGSVVLPVQAGDRSFIISTKTNDPDAQQVVGTETFNALYVDTSNPSSGFNWRMTEAKLEGSGSFNKQLPQADGNYWRNCAFHVDANCDIRITFDGGKIRCDIVAPNIVTFKDGETTLSTQEVSNGGKATQPTNPTKAGYTFVEWQLDGSKYDFSSAVNSNITLNAVWAYKAIESVSLNESEHMTWVGNSDFTLTPTYSPSDVITKAVTWSSNNESVATVNNDGIVHAVGAGTATITCTVTDQYDTKKTATCEVTVAACEMATDNIYSMTVNGYNTSIGHDADLEGLWNESSDNDGPASMTICNIRIGNNGGSNEYFAYDNNGNVCIEQRSSDDVDKWYMINAGTNLYYLKNVSTGKYMYCGPTNTDGSRGNGWTSNGDWFLRSVYTSTSNGETDNYKFYKAKDAWDNDIIVSRADASMGAKVVATDFVLSRQQLTGTPNVWSNVVNNTVSASRGATQGGNSYKGFQSAFVNMENIPNPNYKASQMNGSYYRMNTDATVQANLNAALVSGAVITVRLYADAATTVKLQKTDGTEIETINLTADTEFEYSYTVNNASPLLGENAFVIKAVDNHAGIASIVVTRTYAIRLAQLIEETENGGTLTLTCDYATDNAVINKAITIKGQGHTIGDLTVEYEGDLTLSSELTVRDFTIWAKAGNTSIPAASGQVRNANNLTVSGNAYFLYTVDPSGEVQYGWYDFTVPFPINIVSGIKGIQDGVLEENFRNGVDYAVMEYFGDKQAQGQYPYKKFSGVMQPKKLYTITLSNYNTLRMQKTADGALVASDEVTLNAYAGDDINKNWNGVGNGTLHHADAGISGNYIQVYQSGSKTFLPVIKNDYSFVVGTAFMVQETGTMTLSQATHGALLAPSRYESAPATAIQIASEGKPFSDQLFITASETGGQAYTPGVDVAKAGELGSANVPQIWTNAYNSSLCVHEAQLINGKAQYKLSIYAPVAGSYTLTSKNIPADYSLYLTQNGMIVSELSDTYTLDLSKGITTEYGLLLTEIYNSPTGIENTQTDKIQTTKIIRNGVLYILHNGKVYNAQGAKVK